MASWQDIENRESMEAWLDGQPREDAIAIAARAALRVMPIWADFCETETAQKGDLTPLPVLRSCLVSSVAAVSPTDEIKASAAASAASSAAYATYADNASTAADDAYTATSAAASYVAADSNPNTALTAISAAGDALAITTAGSAAYVAAWEAVRKDAQEAENGAPIPTGPLWPGDNPLQKEWDATRDRWSEPDSPYAFWRRWYDSLLDPQSHRPLPQDLLYKIALIPNETWDAGPETVAEAIREIEAEFAGGGEGIETALARAYLFDFVKHDRKLRMAGVDLDFEGLSPEATEKCLAALRDWTEDLRDWLDFVGDELVGSNKPCKLQRAAQKIIDLVEQVDGPTDFPAGRLVSMGGNLRLLALDGDERVIVGDTLAMMLDARLDDLSGLLGKCFGHVLARLEPLNDLDLGDHDPADLIEGIREALDRIKQADPSELVQLDADAQATLAEMIRELEELDAAISAADDPKLVQTLRARFAARYGGFAATVGRAVEKGQEVAGKAATKFDNAVKWYKRLETLERIVDWIKDLGGLGGPPPGMG